MYRMLAELVSVPLLRHCFLQSVDFLETTLSLREIDKLAKHFILSVSICKLNHGY